MFSLADILNRSVARDLLSLAISNINLIYTNYRYGILLPVFVIIDPDPANIF